tara:strand:- start:752 stop:1021 length:270 start_codon:yes stop_codon:yes gene_type:complete
MANLNDKVVLDLTDDPELASYVASKAPGEECTMTITTSLDEQTDDQAVFSVKGVSVQQYGDEPEEGGEEAVLAVMLGDGASNKKKAESY